MDHKTFMKWLGSKGACFEGRAWVREGRKTLEQAWYTCPDRDWLMWFIHRLPDGCITVCGRDLENHGKGLLKSPSTIRSLISYDWVKNAIDSRKR